MKKFLFILLLTLSFSTFSKSLYEFDIVPINREGQKVKIVRILEGEYMGLYGIIDSQENFLTLPNNFTISVQKNYIYLMDNNYNEGIMTLDGKWIAPMGKYSFKISHSDMYKDPREDIEKHHFVVVSKESGLAKYGYIDFSGNLVIPFIYDNANDFYEGLACVKLDDKWGYIDPSGKTIIAFNYDMAHSFKYGLASVREGSKWYYIDRLGNKKRLKSAMKNIKEKVADVGYHIGESFEDKLKIKKKTN